MRVLRALLTVFLVGVVFLVCSYATTLLLSYVYDMDQALLNF